MADALVNGTFHASMSVEIIFYVSSIAGQFLKIIFFLMFWLSCR